MTKKIKYLDDVLSEELADLYNAENQLVKAIPKMADATHSIELKSILETHLVQTRNHVSRLEEVFNYLGGKPANVTCKAMKGLVEEGEEIIKKSEHCAARDAAIIGVAQRIEHYEIAAYGTAQSHASLLGLKQIEELLRETLEEEKDVNTRLTDLAEEVINSQAMQVA
ncbi:MAG: DUF892 family protein [Candidatus Omnitrophica bacterium]|nr:DUF892 family protein [Candidatus Omnitrophota bacterium]